MDLFAHLLVNGLTLGSVYALIALGYSLVYGVLKLLNFAHGDVFMVGAFIGYGVLSALGGPSALAVPVPLALLAMLVAAAVGAGALGVVIERLAYRPLRDAPRIAPLITTLGVSFLIQNSVLLLLGPRVRNYDSASWIAPGNGIHAGPVDLSVPRILVIAAAPALMLVLYRLVERTPTGVAMRAVAHDREAAAMLGIDVDRVIVAVFLAGSALAGMAGVMVGLVFGKVFHTMGFAAGLKGFTGAVIGGIGNVPGAMLGGMLIGLAESFLGGYVSTAFQNALAFLLLIVVMLVRPAGLLGRADLRAA